MSFKIITILSALVLTAVVQIHGLKEYDLPHDSEYLAEIQKLMQVREFVDKTAKEIEDAMTVVMLTNKPVVSWNKPSSIATGLLSASFFEPAEFFSSDHVTGAIDNLLQKLKGLVDAAFEKLHQAVELCKDEINKAAEKAETLAKQQLQGVEDTLRKELDELKEQSKAAGTDIDDCLEGNEDRLIELPNKFSAEVVQCVSNKALQALSYVDDAINQGQEVVDEVANISDEIDQCGSGFMRYVCIAKLTVILGKDIITLPAMIEADVMLAQRSLSQFATNAGKCGLKKVNEMGKEGREILTTIGVCIAAK